MYKSIIRPILFKFSPETMHHSTIRLMKMVRYIPFARQIMRGIYTIKDESLEREAFGLKFRNPVGLAAGYDKNAECYDTLGDLGFGFVEIGTVTPKGQGGNPRPRCFRLVEDSAIINRMGFNNYGTEVVVKNLQKYRRRGVVVGGNIGKNTLTPNENAPKDYLKAFRALYDYVDYFVINVSCPNVANLTQLQSKQSTADILKLLKEFRKGQCEYKPILLKISPDLSPESIDTMIEVSKEYKLDGIVATNTSTSREGLLSPKVAEIGNGGLSGKPLTNLSCQTVRYIKEKTQGKMPIIGVGGIMTPDDAVAMIEAGASFVQVYSGLIYNGPSLVKKICKRLIEKEQSTK